MLITENTTDYKAIVVLLMAMCSWSAFAIDKPTGAFSSSVGGGLALSNEHALGALVRVQWQELEPVKSGYNWAAIDDQVAAMDAHSAGKPWSLAIVAGSASPTWLYDTGVASFQVLWRQVLVTVPKFWNPLLQSHLADLADALSQRYNDDPRLKLVYLPQMTSNGIEGHFNGVSAEDLKATADDEQYDPEDFEWLWVDAVKQAAGSFSQALDKKAIAVEVHEMLGSAEIPETIINDLWNDPALSQRVGAAMWWISGNTDYQSDLIDVLQSFPGDLYGQVIGRSDQLDRFPDGDYTAVFEQAKSLGMRYIEPWEYEFKNNTHDQAIEDFNRWSADTFMQQTVYSIPLPYGWSPLLLLILTALNGRSTRH